MKIECMYNTGYELRQYEYEELRVDMLGRFGATGYTEYNELEVGKEYLVMGIIIFNTYQAYLLDDSGFITAAPCQLFKVTDNNVHPGWCFRLVDKTEEVYPFIQAVFGYPELCSDANAYEKLIVEKDESAQRIYFRRKIELENGEG